MVMGGSGGAAAWGGGFAARVSRRVSHESSSVENTGSAHPGCTVTRTGAQVVTSMPPSAVDRAKPRISRAPRSDDTKRVKRLATIVAASVALAVVSVLFGMGASAASRAEVEHATAGSLPTLVAARDIHAGDMLSAQTVEVRDVPASYRSSSALSGEALDYDGALQAARALVDIPTGTQISSSFVTGAGAQRLAAELATGKQAVTLAVDVETGLAGHVRPYDVVRIVSAEGASSGDALLETVCERARVMAVGDEASGVQSGSASVTVEVSPEEADAVREAQFAGRVSLVLVAAGDALGEALSDGQDN